MPLTFNVWALTQLVNYAYLRGDYYTDLVPPDHPSIRGTPGTCMRSFYFTPLHIPVNRLNANFNGPRKTFNNSDSRMITDVPRLRVGTASGANCTLKNFLIHRVPDKPDGWSESALVDYYLRMKRDESNRQANEHFRRS